MSKLTIEDLRQIFSEPRTDHPGRKGSATPTRGAGQLPKDGLSAKERQGKNAQ